jgi:UDP-N-acetyl-D-galactosamine dehydrogenase
MTAKTRELRSAQSAVAVVGLGYVGLPLAVAFGRHCRTIGYDRSSLKIAACRRGEDPTGEVFPATLQAASRLEFTDDPSVLKAADFIIVAVPTPVDDAHHPDFGPLVSASEAVGTHLKAGAIVIYESTVYPGATAEVCVPVLERCSGLKWKRDFHIGYSPERINPGDRKHSLTNIVKVVSGDDAATLAAVAALYESIVEAGVHRASSIEVAEAAKVIENTQRDLNIALMNELAIIFDRLGIDTTEVLEAAGTKWNFLPFRPGLVGGHCIGVDPYYLTHKAEKVGYHPQVILAGRRINDNMARFVAEKTVKLLAEQGRFGKGVKINVLGLTFKEDCNDIRNSKVADLINELRAYSADVRVFDPMANAAEVRHEYGFDLSTWDALPEADAIVAAVPHRSLLDTSSEQLLGKLKPGGCFVDVKSRFDLDAIRASGRITWRM